MSLWNPYTFGIDGAPALLGAAPPALRVLGAPASAGQLAAARMVFSRFCGVARTSPVPNPTETGRMADGTVYRIAVVGRSAFMEVWPAGAEDEEGVLQPGISFLSNDGLMVLSPPRDFGDWSLHWLPGWRYSADPAPLADARLHQAQLRTGAPAPEPAGYLLSPAQFTPGTQYLAQLGGYVKFPLDLWTLDANVAEVVRAEAQSILVLAEGADSFFAVRAAQAVSQNINFTDTWHDLEDKQLAYPNPKSYPTLRLGSPVKLFDKRSQDSDSTTTRTLQNFTDTTAAFAEERLWGKYAASDAGAPLLVNRLGDVEVRINESGNVTGLSLATGPVQQLSYRHYSSQTKEVTLASAAPVKTTDLPVLEVTPQFAVRTTYWDGLLNALIPLDRGLGPAVSVTRTVPNLYNKGTVIESGGGSLPFFTSVFYAANEPIEYRSQRTLSQSALLGVFRASGGLETVFTQSSEECIVTAQGTATYRRYVRVEDPLHLGDLQPAKHPSEGMSVARQPDRIDQDKYNYDETLEYSTLTTARFGRFGTLTLARKATSGRYTHSLDDQYTVPRYDNNSFASTAGRYSWSIASREVKLYDPLKDILCYVELEYSNAHNFEMTRTETYTPGSPVVESSTSEADNPVPELPLAKLVMRCGGTQIERAFRFVDPADEKELRRWAARLHPYTGVAYGRNLDGSGNPVVSGNALLTADKPGFATMNFGEPEDMPSTLSGHSQYGGSFFDGMKPVPTGLTFDYLADPLGDGLFIVVTFPQASGLGTEYYLADRYGIAPAPANLLDRIEATGADLKTPRAF